MLYAVYTLNSTHPSSVFTSRKKAVEFIGNATSLYSIVPFRYITPRQVDHLPYTQALSFEMAMAEAVSQKG